MLMNLNREQRQPLDLDTIRSDNPLPSVAGAVVRLHRAGAEWKACCPFHADRTPSFTIFASGERFHCFGCGASGDVLDFVQRLHGVGFREAAAMLGDGDVPVVALPSLPAKDKASDRTDEAQAIWSAAQPIEGTLADSYLRGRGITIALPDALRFAVLPYGQRGQELPCMVAAVTNLSGAVVGIQRTYLNGDGSGKADVPSPRLSLGRLAGGAVRLTPPARRLILTEGVEDALSLIQMNGKAAWAALGTSNLGRIELPFAVENVVIGADNDEAGSAAAEKAAQVYADKGCRVRIICPLACFKDFNEELQKGAGK